MAVIAVAGVGDVLVVKVAGAGEGDCATAGGRDGVVAKEQADAGVVAGGRCHTGGAVAKNSDRAAAARLQRR